MPNPEPKSWYAVNKKAQANDAADISIYDDIGGYGITAKQFVDDLKSITAGTINLRLNTDGGEITEGTAIYNALKQHPARIIVHIEGIAASAGSFIAMSGDEVRMADNAYLMIHNGRGGVFGEASDMRKQADILEKMNGNIAGMYEKKTGKPREHWRALMDAETWFTAEEAKAEGLADAIYAAAPPQARATASECVKFYNKIPDGARRLLGLEAQHPAPEDSLRREPPPANTKENSAMPEPIQAAPAPTPAAPSNAPVTSQGPSTPPTEAENRRAELVRLNAQAIETCTEQGRVKGVGEGRQFELDRAKAIAEACPGKPEMALAAILGAQEPAAVKVAFQAASIAEAKYRAEAEAMQHELDRWKALATIGGHPGVATSLGNTDELRQGMDPQARAEWEWEHDPDAKKTASTKEIYLLARVAELDGTHRSLRPVGA